ncbi:SPFH domain-containing protein [Halobellus ruber]|uniref:SPFH/Band 7/PHB domain protein n=1 Tax=Halobellus ruber TaxID=2761102 RepID=A0A7J9SMQ9_9EURY|nr:SPFH domain-containing protein [Halobellus ruber]MBB6647376.1 SPFH/Band 7/PHB domain protein [Halobellus ruber]
MSSIFRELGRRSVGSVPSRLLPAAAVVVALILAVTIFGTDPTTIVGLAVLAVAVATVYSAVEIVNAYEKRALTVFGEYRRLLEPGISFVPPFVSKTYTFDMRTQTIDVPKQEAITRDNSPVTADAVVYIRVMDAKRAFLEVDDYEGAVSDLAQTTLRAVLGDMELDDTLSEREVINRRINEELDEPTDEWGIRVESVEVRSVKPSRGVEDAMEQQSSAERRRRAMILEAQGERRSAIETAEGERQSNVISAQGEKQASVLRAQGDAVATVLRARASESMGERAIVDRGLESLERIGTSPSSTFVLPQELTSLLGRYGRGLTDSDVQESAGLESLDFDRETRELLGLDDIDEIIAAVEDAESGEAVGDLDGREGDSAADVDLNLEGSYESTR